MDLFTSIFLALGLSADAFAVSVTNGICSQHITKKDAFATAVTFGAFQSLMPIIGYYLGKAFTDIISRYQHYVALILLAAIGINMLVEAIKEQKHPEEDCKVKDIFGVKNLILQGIATSIDALAVGVGFIAMKINIYVTSLLIGVITFLCCLFGVYIGKKFGSLLGVRARFVGGVLLVVIGLRIFIQNQF